LRLGKLKSFIYFILLVKSMGNKIIRKAFVNKKTKQLSISIPKKKLKLMDPTIKFSEDLFVEIIIVRRKK